MRPRAGTDNAHRQVVCVSTAWTDAGSVVVGFSGVVYRVNVSPSGIAVVKVEKSFLQNTHFARSHAAYIQIPYLPVDTSNAGTVSMQSNSVRTCALLNGFVELEAGDTHNGYIALRGRYSNIEYTIPPFVYEVSGKQGASIPRQASQYTTASEAYQSQSSVVSSNINVIVPSTGNIYEHTCMQMDLKDYCYMVIDTPADSHVRIQIASASQAVKKIVAHDGGHIRIFKGVPTSNSYIYGRLDDSSHADISEDPLNPLTTYVGNVYLCNGAEIVVLKTYDANTVPNMLDRSGLRHVSYAAEPVLSRTRLDDAWKYVHAYFNLNDNTNDASADLVAISVHLRRTEADNADGEVDALDEQRTVAIDALTLLPVLSIGALVTGCERAHGLGPECGDGARSADEECDDGGVANNDGCSSQCTMETGWTCSGVLCGRSQCSGVCGDGIRTSDEACDDSNVNNADGCSAMCTLECGYTLDPSDDSSLISACGNGAQSPGEYCDDGNTVGGDGCDASCNIEDGFHCVFVPCEESICDGRCGDGVMQSDKDETCDDNGIVNGDGCSDECTVECGFECQTDTYTVCSAMCGDGVRTDTASEACDDGNIVDGDGCDSTCKVEDDWQCQADACVLSVCGQCGDGIKDPNEECDDSGTTSGDGCSGACELECGFICTGIDCYYMCGDGVVHASEECDDGNTDNDDGCSHICTVETAWVCQSKPVDSCSSSVCTRCGDGIVSTNEECDDSNVLDGCSSACTIECGYGCPGGTMCYFDCGDGILHTQSEECDDGNVDDGDGCDSACHLESVFEGRVSQTSCGLTTFNGYCGDGNVNDNSAETCDDGNIFDGDGCSAACTVECGYECETGGTVTPQCKARCGDERLHEHTEECDDGNTEDGDCCDSACRLESGCEHRGLKDELNCFTGESSGICGDGFIVDNESCDDGNTGPGDGCSDVCTTENGYTCTGTPSSCSSSGGVMPTTRRLLRIDTRNASVRDTFPPKTPSAAHARAARARRLLQADATAPRFQYQSLVYVPTATELAMLGLGVVLHGDDAHNWRRLHVTVTLEWTLPQSCAWTLSVHEVDATTVVYSMNSALSRLGCTIMAANDTYAVCHLEVNSAPSRAPLAAARCCLRDTARDARRAAS